MSAKIAELTPMASARVVMATIVNPGVLTSCRNANRKSWIIELALSDEMQSARVLDSSSSVAVALWATWAQSWIASALRTAKRLQKICAEVSESGASRFRISIVMTADLTIDLAQVTAPRAKWRG